MFLILLFVAAFSVFFVPWRLSSALAKKGLFWKLLVLAAIIVFGYAAVIMSRLYARPSYLFAGLFDVLGVALIFHGYLFALLLVLFPFARLLRGRRGKAAALTSVGVALCLSLWGLYNAMTFRVTEWVIEVPGLTEPLTILHAPDLHLGAARGKGFLQKITTAINECDPDLVIYNGDIVDSNLALNPDLFALFKEVKAPQYFTLGNHEYYIDTERALELITSHGIRILRSELVDLGEVNLIGMLYMNGDRGSNDSHRVNDLFLSDELPKIQRDLNKPTVLVHHSPVGMKYAQEGGVDVYLAGHTHGGQVFPGTLMIKRMFPYYKGRHELSGMTLLVSQGAGTFGPPLRLGTFAEIQLVRLVPPAKKPS
jgi:predicted MPP superfamily phosphohydrolase